MNSPITCEQSDSKVSTYFTVKQWLYYVLIIVIGIGLRWFELETRPFHHDESQHAMFGKYFYDFPEIQYYKYDPMMHAPLLYNFFRVVYTAFGNTLWASRAPIALMGTIFLFLPLLFRRYFTPTALLALTAGLAFSSNMVYWSRFVIHDYFVISAMLLTLYGAVLADAKRKSFFVLLGFALQFCIKANVFVTVALILGYLVFEAVFRYFIAEGSKDNNERFFAYLKSTWLYAFAVSGVLITVVHFAISLIPPDHKDWSGLYQLSQSRASFIALASVLALSIYFLLYFLLQRSSSAASPLLSRSIDNILVYKKQFVVSLAVSVIVFCYIFSSGFRHSAGILDGLFYKSIPYWLNQHNIERIKGPLLFNFYMFSWYEFALLIFFLIHLFIFYKASGKVTKIAGLSTLGVSVILGLTFLIYTAPESVNGNWLSVETVSDRSSGELKSFADKIATAFSHEFKLKDCLDVFALLLLIIHPVIVTATHIYRKERILAFWGYYFTANFFTYSFLGEKVPWLFVYPLVPGFIYLTLFFDDYYKKNPVRNFEKYPLEKVFRAVYLTLLGLGVIFILEKIFSISGIFAPEAYKKLFDYFTLRGLRGIATTISSTVEENILLFMPGFLLYLICLTNKCPTRFINLTKDHSNAQNGNFFNNRYYVLFASIAAALLIFGLSYLPIWTIFGFESAASARIYVLILSALILLAGLILFCWAEGGTDICGTVNIKNLLFIAVSIFCIRGAILTNFVYAGSETEYISQVHTTKEFHDMALRLRQEALTNIRPDEFKILGDGDPVWPLTWYMVGVNSFKFSATDEERKDFDVILQTWDENPKNVPPGFAKRRLNLRGWWVPDFNQMTLRKFLNVSINHFPWSPSGFTYVWLFINPNKGGGKFPASN